MNNKIKNVSYVPAYWDEGQKRKIKFEWFKKGWWKRYYRKRWLKNNPCGE